MAKKILKELLIYPFMLFLLGFLFLYAFPVGMMKLACDCSWSDAGTAWESANYKMSQF